MTDAAEVLPIAELDHAVAPLRRAVTWVSADPEARLAQVRFLEPIAARWLGVAQSLALPDEVRALLGEAAGHVEGFDADDATGRARRVGDLYQTLTRLDALLGLPVRRHLRKVPARPLPPPDDDDDEDDDDEDDDTTTDDATSDDASPDEGRSPSRRRTGRPGPPSPRPKSWSGALHEPLAECLDDADVVARLAAAGLNTAADLLLLEPRSEELLKVHGAGRGLPSGRVAVGGRVVAHATRVRPGARHRLLVVRGAGTCVIEVDAAARLRGGLPAVGAKVILVCDSRVEASDPHGAAHLVAHEQCGEATHQTVRLASYGCEGVDDATVRTAVLHLLSSGVTVPESLPPGVAASQQLTDPTQALVTVHTRPFEAGEAARARLRFDEALLAHLSTAWPRYQSTQDRGIAHVLQHNQGSLLVTSQVEGGLRDPQQLALDDIKRDVRRALPMRRLLLSEVGSGRGMITLAAITMVAQSKSQVMCISASSAAAEQHFAMAEPLLREAGMVARLVEAGARRNVRDAIGRGEVHVVFGSQALLDESIQFRRLGLVIVEERDAFGSCVPKLGAWRSPRPHVLVVPTTPVGLGVTLRAYPDFDVTVVEDEARRPVAVDVRGSGERAEVYAEAREAIDQGAQVIVAFPMVRGADALDIREALRVVRALQGDAFAGHQVALYHGSMSREERRKAFDDFLHRRGDVLFATTVIEDGPSIPGAALLVVEQAERVDEIRLHRLHGYLSRALREPRISLIVGEMADAGDVERLREVMGAPSGFEVHERQATRRGLDALVHAEAAPLPRLSWVDLARDRALGWQANRVAHTLLRSDPGLRRGNHARLAAVLRSRWAKLWPEGPPCPVPDVNPERRRRRRRRRRR